MLPDRVSNLGPLTYESGALPTALRRSASCLVCSWDLRCTLLGPSLEHWLLLCAVMPLVRPLNGASDQYLGYCYVNIFGLNLLRYTFYVGILGQIEQPHQCSSSKAAMQTQVSLTFIHS